MSTKLRALRMHISILFNSDLMHFPDDTEQAKSAAAAQKQNVAAMKAKHREEEEDGYMGSGTSSLPITIVWYFFTLFRQILTSSRRMIQTTTLLLALARQVDFLILHGSISHLLTNVFRFSFVKRRRHQKRRSFLRVRLFRLALQ